MSPSSLCCVTNALDVFLYLQELHAILIRISNNTHINTKREREGMKRRQGPNPNESERRIPIFRRY
jgi:hypothetical protein